MALRLTRIPVNIPATYSLKGHESEGKIVDISSNGLGMEVRQIFVIGDLIRIQFATTTDAVDFWGIVRRISGGTIGIQFEEISKENEEKIEEFVNDLLREKNLRKQENF